MKASRKIGLPTDLPDWYIKKYSNLLQPVRATVFLYATAALLITLIFYFKNKKTVVLKLQHRIHGNNSLSRYLENAKSKTVLIEQYSDDIT